MLCFCATAQVYGQPGGRPAPQRTAPGAPVPPPGPHHHAMSNRIFTYYNINSPVGGGATLDSTWRRPTIEDLLDTGYTPLLPRLPEQHLPPVAERGKPDPMTDNTKSCLTSHYSTIGYSASLPNASAMKEAIALELFGYAERVPADLVEPVRQATEAGLMKRPRHYTMDAQTILGGAYDGAAVYYGGQPGQFHFTPRMEQLYCSGVRYVLSGFISQYLVHAYYLSESSKNLTYEVNITVHYTAYDLDTKTILQTKIMTVHGSGSKQEYADREAIGWLPSSVASMAYENFRFTTTMAGLGEPDKKGHIKTCTIAAGYNMAAEKGDRFAVFNVNDHGQATEIGRVRITEIKGNDLSEAKITQKQEDVRAAFESGANLILMSD